MCRFTILMFLSLTGCLFPMNQGGTEQLLDDRLLETITVGTAQADVRAKLGEPQQILQTQDATGAAVKWIYGFWRQGNYELIPAYREQYSRPAIQRSLTISFSPEGTVTKLEHSQTAIKDPALIILR